MSGFHVALGTLLQPVLIIVAAVLLLRAQNGPRLLPAAILLLISQTLALLSMRQTVMYADEMGAASSRPSGPLCCFSAYCCCSSA